MGKLEHLAPLRDAITRVVDIQQTAFSHSTPGVESQFVGILQGVHEVLGGTSPDHVAGWSEDRESPGSLHLHLIFAGRYAEIEVRSGAHEMRLQTRHLSTLASVEFPTLPVPRVHGHFEGWGEFLGTAMNLTFADGHEVSLPATSFGYRGRSFEGFKNALLAAIG